MGDPCRQPRVSPCALSGSQHDSVLRRISPTWTDSDLMHGLLPWPSDGHVGTQSRPWWALEQQESQSAPSFKKPRPALRTANTAQTMKSAAMYASPSHAPPVSGRAKGPVM